MTADKLIEDNSRVTSVWSAHGHRFMSDGDPPYESCLTCGAMYQLLACAEDPTRGVYLAMNGDEPMPCSHDTSMTHGYEDASDPNCNCCACA
jgi:hypothetical protein